MSEDLLNEGARKGHRAFDAERHKLDESITQLQANERCVRRAVGLMALLIMLALAGVCYAVIFLEPAPQSMTQLITPRIVKIFCALGGASLICILAFGGLGLIYRKELERRREECRRLATKFLESRPGKPRALKETARETLPEESRHERGRQQCHANESAR